MDVTLDPFRVPPQSWHTVGLDFLKPLLISAWFDNVLAVVNHLAGMANIFPCTKELRAEETTIFGCPV
jgi:hypothetical protein